MKKRVLFILGLFLFALVAGVVSSADDNPLENMSESQRVKLGYDCLYDSIVEKNCSRLSLEEQIFSLLSLGECYDEVMEASRLEECWPKTGCDVKTTALAALALDNANEDVDKAINWLYTQNSTPTDLNWYLEIESPKETSCVIKYRGTQNTISIGEDKKINSNAGSCLVLDPSRYWLGINPDCYEEEFEISCNEDFLSTLIFKNPDSATIYVVDETHSAAAQGITFEKIKSSCFTDEGECDYESSLWATMVLDILGEEVSSFVPYVITKEEDNPEYFPSPFLYFLTGYPEYKLEILSKQKTEGSWDVLNGKFYSSALAMYPFQGSTLDAKDKLIEWLFETQSEEGCWDNGNIRSNAFILHSIWPKRVSINGGGSGNVIDDEDPCEIEGYKCTSSFLCGGEVLDYDCSGALVCCSESTIEEDTCADYNGEICSSNEVCVGGNDYTDLAGLGYGEVCCVWGSCEEDDGKTGPTENECESEGGTCESSCGEGYKKTIRYDCDLFSDDVCCIVDNNSPIDEPEETKSYWWLWILFLLIVLVTLGILFKDKVREFILKIQTKSGKKGPSKGGNSSHIPPRGPPSYPRQPMRRPIPQRKILPPQTGNRPREPIRQPLPNSKNKELDDVLKKLKEMGN